MLLGQSSPYRKDCWEFSATSIPSLLTTIPHLDPSSTFDFTGPKDAQQTLNVGVASRDKHEELEYAETWGKIHVPRAVNEPGVDDKLPPASGAPRLVRKSLGDVDSSSKITISPEGDRCLASEYGSSQYVKDDKEIEAQVEYVALDKLEASTRITSSQGW